MRTMPITARACTGRNRRGHFCGQNKRYYGECSQWDRRSKIFLMIGDVNHRRWLPKNADQSRQEQNEEKKSHEQRRASPSAPSGPNDDSAAQRHKCPKTVPYGRVGIPTQDRLTPMKMVGAD